MSARKENPGTSRTKPVPTQRSVEEDSMLSNVVTSFFKKAAVVLAVWAAGYYRFSPSWLVLGLVLLIWKERRDTTNRDATAVAQAIAKDERAFILAKVKDLPSWVSFPDVERAEWVNKMISQMWPFVSQYVHSLLQESIEPMIRDKLPPTLGSFRFSRIDLGDIAPRIGGVKVNTRNIRRDEIYIDLEVIYASDSNIAVQVKGMNFGVKDFRFRGTLRMIFRPLINEMPLIGGMNIFFLSAPELDFNLTNLANALDLPGLSDALHGIIQEQVAAYMVLPNRIPISLVDNVDFRRLKFPEPQGVLRVQVIEARDLKKADFNITGGNTSDPYAIVTVGAQTFQTKVIDKTVDPVWDQVFEYVVDETDGQILQLGVKDKDTGSQDDNLGSLTMDIVTVFQKGSVDEDQDQSHNDDFIHSALLLVRLDSAISLPRGSKALQEPSAFALLTVGQMTQESAVRAATTDPCWEQNFNFFVANPNYQNLDVEVRCSKTKKGIGYTSIHLKDLMTAEDMVMDKKFPLKAAQRDSAVYMTVVLRMLTQDSTKSRRWAEDSEVDPPVAGADGSKDPPPASNINENSISVNAVSTAAASSSQEDNQPRMASSAITENSPSPPLSEKEEARCAGSEPVGMTPSSAAATSDVRQRKSVSSASSQASNANDDGEFGLGRIQMTFRYSSLRCCLVIVVHRISNLKPAAGDSSGLADPYVKMYLLPSRDKKSKRKTQVIKDDLNPVFDDMFEYSVSSAELPHRKLEVVVKNETGLFSTSQSLLGAALVDLSTLGTSKAITQWFDLAPQDAVKPCAVGSEL